MTLFGAGHNRGRAATRPRAVGPSSQRPLILSGPVPVATAKSGHAPRDDTLRRGCAAAGSTRRASRERDRAKGRKQGSANRRVFAIPSFLLCIAARHGTARSTIRPARGTRPGAQDSLGIHAPDSEASRSTREPGAPGAVQIPYGPPGCQSACSEYMEFVF